MVCFKKIAFSSYFLFFLVLLSFVTSNKISAQQLAFPGAEGFGKYAKGGRGGDVYEVSNLNDAGPGSFRQGVTASGSNPLTVVFRVSGIIELASNIKISRSNLTIAGQTAPGDGICFRNYSLIFNGAKIGGNHGDVIIRYIRSRPGGNVSTGLYGFDMENSHDVIIDHCSFSWANEEVAAMYDTKNVSVQYCIMSEGLYSAGHAKGVRSYCGVWGGQYSSYHHNLITNNVSRTIRFDGSRAHDTIAVVDYRNNVIYNWGSTGAAYGGEVMIPGGVSQANIVNNYYKPGPATSNTRRFLTASYGTPAYGTGQWYVAGNVMVGDATKTADNWLGVDVNSNPEAERPNAKSIVPFPISRPLPEETAEAAYQNVLANAGAIFPKRDATDERIVLETTNGTATGSGTYGKPGIIDAPTSVGGYATYNSIAPPADEDHDGMADDWELANSLNPANAADRNTINSDGYTMLEVYLNNLIVPQVLPLKLVGFDAKILQQQANKTQLSWVTNNEINVWKFVVERSADGIKFNSISEVPAKNINGTHSYIFTDRQTLSGISYYRLKLWDINGKFEYSRTIAVELNHATGVGLFPNPAGDFLTIVHPQSSVNTPVNLLSSDGKIIMKANTGINVNQTSMNVSGLKAGIYVLSYTTNKKPLLFTFIKQ
ncbi:MAG: T9SS type A sorting domain-containing protein [Bacteroidota bacterium]